MKRITLFLLLLVPLVAYAGNSAPEAGKAKMLKGRYVIDVRTEDEWKDGHIEGAIHIPHDQIKDRIAEVTKDKTAPLALYCASGGRSGRALKMLQKEGYQNVENLGSIEAAKKKLAAAR